MDVSSVSETVLSRLKDAYDYAGTVYHTDPLAASGLRRHRMRRFVSAQISGSLEELPGEIRAVLLNGNDRRFFALLQEASDEIKRRQKAEGERFGNEFAFCAESVRHALGLLLRSEVWPPVKEDSGKVRILLDDTQSYRRILTLTNAKGAPLEKEGYFCSGLTLRLRERKHRCCLRGELTDPCEEEVFPFALEFDSASVEVRLYNACAGTTLDSPWGFLSDIARSIEMKAELPGEYCSSAERELLPLLHEIATLESSASGDPSFENLKRLAKKHGVPKTVKQLCRLERKRPGSFFYRAAAKRLTARLSMESNAPLWREIYEKIRLSQEQYPAKAEKEYPSDRLESIRARIQKEMEGHGYLGSYPDFSKDAPMQGIHLGESYGVTYVLACRKCRCFIHCVESYEEVFGLTVQFLCGTALLKKSSGPNSVFDCIFNARGSRMLHSVWHTFSVENREHDGGFTLETDIRIAVKKAECKKLTKQEKREYYGGAMPGLGTFLSVFLIMGGMFGILMTLAMMLFCVVVTAAFAGISSVPEMFLSIPWQLIFAIGWIGFGGAMGIITLKK